MTSSNIYLMGGDYLIDSALRIDSGKNFTFNVDPSSQTSVLFKRVSTYFSSLFDVKEGASLIFKSSPGKMIIDGGSTSNPSTGIMNETGLLLNNRGTTVIDGAEFTNQHIGYGAYVAPIYSNGPNSTLHLISGSIHDNKITANSQSVIYSSNAVLVENGGTMIMDGGDIYNNTIASNLLNSDSVGVVNISDGSKFTMNGGKNKNVFR
ncbi:hypothetical protein [Peptostreptococcus equinus]|uniref:Right handed beta helix region n=1 Tax=Peptostreptococcus equinus TaxID=3003601 RepID=A0ABY7JR98_9FIRM|nr:hypothetical protein [Peptostreptococcus sp. CBA3647]WAW15381.1 hypothetical protein O0R46_02750 [Peptostreptococcus sp. CBA3647]